MTRANPTETFIMREVTFGWSCWERKPDGADYQSRGGMVVAAEDKVDPDTAEIVRWFEVLDFDRGWPRFTWLNEHAISVESINLPNTLSMRSSAKRMNELLARVRGTFTSEHVRWQELALKFTTGVG